MTSIELAIEQFQNSIKDHAPSQSTEDAHSLRFNQMLDASDLEVPYYGRATWCARVFDFSPAWATKFLSKNQVLRHSLLVNITDFMSDQFFHAPHQPTGSQLRTFIQEGLTFPETQFIADTDSYLNLCQSYVDRYYRTEALISHKEKLDSTLYRSKVAKALKKMNVSERTFVELSLLKSPVVFEMIKRIIDIK